MTNNEQIEKLATAAARRYKVLCWWADEADLKQEAWACMLRASRTWDESGAPLGAYLWIACVRHLGSYLWRQSSPVSASDHSLTELRGLHRAPLEAIATRPDHAQNPAAQIEAHNHRQRVRAELHDLAAQVGVVRYVTALLDGEGEPAKMAVARGVQASAVYHERQMFMAAARNDAALYQLWEESDA